MGRRGAVEVDGVVLILTPHGVVFMSIARHKMATHSLRLSDSWYGHVASGHKRYEGRRRTPAVDAMRPGDTLVFTHASDPTLPALHCTVVAVLPFDTFRDALEALPLSEVLPGVATVDEGCAVYARFVSLPTQIRDGVCMLELTMC